MDDKTAAYYKAKANIIKAMAHPTRLFIIDRLAIEEHCVGDLTALIGADASTVSKHLSVLKAAGIVTDQKRSNQVFYSLKTPCILHFFGCVEAVVKLNAEEHLEFIR